VVSVWEVACRFRHRVEEALEPIGLSLSAYDVLSRLRVTGGEADVAEVAAGLRMSSTEVLAVAKELAAQGLAHLSARGQAARVTATTRGRARGRAARLRLEVVLRDLTASFTPTERAALRRLLGRVRVRRALA
jgi:DNA-binding MarR family transcriptional regulator